MNKEVLKQAISKYGKDAQVNMIKEECLELALAIVKFQRERNAINLDNVIEEIADVKIMIEQAEILFPKTLIETNVKNKINRLKKRLAK